MKIRKRRFVRIISFLTAAIFVLCGCALSQLIQKNNLKERIALGYKQSISEFSSLISEINTDLKKQLYSSSPEMLSALSADIYKNSSAAKECLERLPVSQENTDNIYKFLATAGDFSKAVAVSNTDEVTEENKKQLKKLINFSEKLADGITQAAMDLEESNSLTEDVDNVMDKLENETAFSAITEDISEIAADVPTLIYDGPFSDHINRRQALLLENKQEITKEQALIKAKFYADEDDLKYTCDENSNTESYIFEDEDVVCAVTKKGGYCLYMNKTEVSDSQKITDEQAIAKAKQYLNNITGLNFCESYYIINENIMTVNLAFCENDIIYYSDLIKVGVALDNGEIVSVEARGFIMNHHTGKKYDFKNTEQAAKNVINNELTVNKSQKALITDNALNEIYCYEFKCKASDGGDVIVYINDQTLKEENVFIINHVEGGTLVS